MLFDDFPLIFKGLEMISAKQYVHFPSLPMYVELYPNTLNFVRGRRILSRYVELCPGTPPSKILTFLDKMNFVQLYNWRKNTALERSGRSGWVAQIELR